MRTRFYMLVRQDPRVLYFLHREEFRVTEVDFLSAY